MKLYQSWSGKGPEFTAIANCWLLTLSVAKAALQI